MENNLKFLKSSIFTLGVLFGALAMPWQPLSATWQPAEIISNPAQSIDTATGTVLAVNPQGNALALWMDTGNPVWGEGFDTITSNFYVRGIGWQGPLIISSLAPNSFGERLYDNDENPDVAMNSSNYAVAVWNTAGYTEDPFPDCVTATVRQSNGVWGPVQIISEYTDELIATNINVALNEAGTAVAAWRDFFTDEPYTNQTKVSILPFGGSWSAPINISGGEDPSGNDLNNKPCVQINEAGDIVVVWCNATNSINAATYNAGTATWSPPVNLDSSFRLLEKNPRCAIDENGNAIAVWLLDVDGDLVVKTAFFTYGTGWGPSEIIGSDARNPAMVVMDPAGNATATWANGNEDGKLYSAYKPVGGVWTAPEVIATGLFLSQAPYMSQEPLAVDAAGNVMTVWTEDNNLLRSAYRLFNQPWQSPEIVYEGFLQSLPSVGLASCGFAVALWDNFDNVLAAVNENIFAPFGTRYRQCTARFASQKVSLDILGWDPFPAECILAYNIYCNGTLVGEVGGIGPYEFVYSTCKKCNYTLTSVNSWGFESDAVPFLN